MAQIASLHPQPQQVNVRHLLPGVVETDMSRRIVGLLNTVASHGGLGVIVAPTGSGKTHTIKAWAKENCALCLSMAGGPT